MTGVQTCALPISCGVNIVHEKVVFRDLILYFNIGKEQDPTAVQNTSKLLAIFQGQVDWFDGTCQAFIPGFFNIAHTKITMIKLVMTVRRGITWATKDEGTGVGLIKSWLRIMHGICFWWSVLYSIGKWGSRRGLWRIEFSKEREEKKKKMKGIVKNCRVGYLWLQRVSYIYIYIRFPYQIRMQILRWYLH